MGQLLQLILDNLYKLWPVRIVDLDEQGVRLDRGKYAQLLKPGIHWFIPGLQSIEKQCVTYQEIDCLIQSMETKDEISISFSCNVGYVIHDFMKYRLAVQDQDGTIERRTRGILGEIVEENNVKDLRGARKRLAQRTKNRLVKETEAWGIEVQNVCLTDFVKTRQYRLFGGIN